MDNTFRDPKVKGCGLGDVKTMLETRYLGGKCADLNALYVGLARAAGLPARDVYGCAMRGLCASSRVSARAVTSARRSTAAPRSS